MSRPPVRSRPRLAVLWGALLGLTVVGSGLAGARAEDAGPGARMPGPGLVERDPCTVYEYVLGTPTVPVAPSASLAGAVGGPFSGLDGGKLDTHFATTFSFPKRRCVTAAKLEIRARPIGGNAGNDQIYVGAVAGGPRWNAYFGGLNGNNTNAFPTLVASNADWTSQPAQNFTLDLLNLPVRSQPQPTSLLSAIENGTLDLYVQDDTAILTAKLTVKVCPCKARLCVAKFEDVDGDGRIGPRDTRVPGIGFQVTHERGRVVGTLQTGERECMDVDAPGTYTVTETVPAGWMAVLPAGGKQTVTLEPGEARTLSFLNRRCPERVLLAGQPDEFAAGADVPAPDPSPALAQLVTGLPQPFDHPGANYHFGHTFRIRETGCVTEARLAIRLRPSRTQSLPDDDGLNVGFVSPQGVFSSWAAWIGKGGNGGTPNALQQVAWTASSPATTFTLDLGSLPASGGGTVLALLDSKRVLDVYVQDDSSVDFVRLTYRVCPCDRNGPVLPDEHVSPR